MVLARQGQLPGPDAMSDAATVITTDASLYVMILGATLLLGIAEVLYDNSAQTFPHRFTITQHPSCLARGHHAGCT